MERQRERERQRKRRAETSQNILDVHQPQASTEVKDFMYAYFISMTSLWFWEMRFIIKPVEV